MVHVRQMNSLLCLLLFTDLFQHNMVPDEVLLFNEKKKKKKKRKKK